MSPTEIYHKSSAIWKVVVLAFTLVGNWLVCKDGVGNIVELWENPVKL